MGSHPQTDHARLRRLAASQLRPLLIRLAVVAVCLPQHHLQFATAAGMIGRTYAEGALLDYVPGNGLLFGSLARRADNAHEVSMDAVVDELRVAKPPEEVSLWPPVISWWLANASSQAFSPRDPRAGRTALQDASELPHLRAVPAASMTATPRGSGKFRANAQAACGDPGVFCPSVNTSANITCFPGMYSNVAAISH